MIRHPHIFAVLAGGLALLPALPASAQSAHAQHHPGKASPDIQTPPSLAAEHRELHATLARASAEGSELGAAATALEQALAPHFRREEEIATPPLGLLPRLAREDATKEMRAILPLTEALERELPRMLAEHNAIRAAATRFRAAAEKAGRAEYMRFSDELAAHARQEEEILYPAAVLVGRYIARTAPER